MILQLSLLTISFSLVTLGVCVWLNRTNKRNLRAMETRYIRRDEILRAKLEELAGEVETVRREMELVEHKTNSTGMGSRTLGSGVRVQAIRMIKLGEPMESIAGALSLPRTDVELLIKVQRLLASTPQQPEL